VSHLPAGGGDDDGADIGWARAIASGAAVLLVGFFGTVYAADAVVTRLTSVSRGTRQYLAGAVFLAVVIVMAWALRRLQARRLI
jgi:hypothetical protein